MLHGVDVSGYQPNWTPGPADDFVFVKATEGRSYVSTAAQNQLHAARAKGLQCGHYHFLHPGNAKAQADWFTTHADIRAGDLLVCDFENTTEGHPTAADRAAFRAEVKRAYPANKEGVYCNRSDWTTYDVDPGDFLWIAEYGVPSPKIAAHWHFWQYADKPLDQNRGDFASLDALKAWARGTPAAPTTPPTTPPAYPIPTGNKVYLSKLVVGQLDSDSVWHLENALNRLGQHLVLDGDFAKATTQAWAEAVFKAASVDVTIINDL